MWNRAFAPLPPLPSLPPLLPLPHLLPQALHQTSSPTLRTPTPAVLGPLTLTPALVPRAALVLARGFISFADLIPLIALILALARILALALVPLSTLVLAPALIMLVAALTDPALARPSTTTLAPAPASVTPPPAPASSPVRFHWQNTPSHSISSI